MINLRNLNTISAKTDFYEPPLIPPYKGGQYSSFSLIGEKQEDKVIVSRHKSGSRHFEGRDEVES